MRPTQLLPWLLGCAVGAAGILQGHAWRKLGSATETSELQSKLEALQIEVDILRSDNESLRSNKQGGMLTLPPELLERVERDTRLTFRTPPKIQRLGESAFYDRVNASVEARFGPNGLDDRQQAYTFLGWITPDDNLGAQLTSIQTVGARTWFDEATGEGAVVDNFNLETIPDQAALLRLLARMIFEQHFPPAEPETYPGDDAWRARDAFFRGATARIESRFYADNVRAIGFLPRKEETEAQSLMATLPPFVQGLATFPAVEGIPAADRFQTPEKLHAALSKPPASTFALLQPEQATPAALALPDTPGDVVFEEAAGELGLRLWLEAVAENPDTAKTLSAAWRGDRYRFYATSDTDLHMLWRIRLADEKNADLVQALALQQLSILAASETAAEIDKPLTTEEKRTLRLRRISPTELEFTNLAEAQASR